VPVRLLAAGTAQYRSNRLKSTSLAVKDLSVNDSENGAAQQRVGTGSARSILLTLLGEFVWPDGRPVWTATLIHVMTGIGINEKSARQAIARANAAGWIEAGRFGRETCWTLTDAGRKVIEDGAHRVHSMSHNLPWDGRWLIVAISLPDSHRSERTKLYRALSWAGFGNPMPGIWVNPHAERESETRRIISELSLTGFTCAFAGPALQIGLTDRQLVDRSWDMKAVAANYDELLGRFGRLKARTDDDTLFNHVQLVNEWQRLPFIDPVLPTALLPPRWRGREVAARLESLRDQWSLAAQERWRALSGISSRG
jgi:phenylacetic acid degradation operon negative regulatory protein